MAPHSLDLKATMSELAERFFARFRGLDRAYGQYGLKGKAKKGQKHLGSAKTIREAPTADHWNEHLTGNITLGIVPICDDGTSWFGAIDIDVYDGLDHKAIAAQILAWDLPLIACRTKSGGLHLYLFCRESIPAELIRGKLMEWSVQLGFSGVEVFPKQTRLANVSDVGNWINMPYFGSKTAKGKGDRYAIFDGKGLSAEAFLKLADTIAVDTDSLRAVAVPTDDPSKGLLREGPPCLQTLHQRGGIKEGGRNNGLFNVGVYLRKRFGQGEWEAHLDEYNQAILDPPLGHKEVTQIVKSVNRKAYEYKCADQPICDVCNRQICLSREFGIATGEGDPGVTFGQLIKVETDPVTWIWDVDGARIELTTQELKDQARFHTRAMEELNKWPLAVKAPDWAKIVRKYLESVQIMTVPEDAKMEGQVMFFLELYCTRETRALNRDDLLKKKPWTDNGRVFFHGPDFRQFLAKQGLRMRPGDLWNQLRERGAEPQFFNIKGQGINVWSLPAFKEQDEPFDVPMIESQGEM